MNKREPYSQDYLREIERVKREQDEAVQRTLLEMDLSLKRKLEQLREKEQGK
jgi:hypothetical protein